MDHNIYIITNLLSLYINKFRKMDYFRFIILYKRRDETYTYLINTIYIYRTCNPVSLS